MATNATVFGGRKMRGGRDLQEERAALQWIYSVLNEPVPDGSFDQLLKDGTVLCRFMQRIEPSLVRKINTGGGPIKLMENLGVFSDACRILGVGHNDLFLSIDLYEMRDIGAVYNCLSQLGGILQQIRPDIPPYGLKTEEKKRAPLPQAHQQQQHQPQQVGNGHANKHHSSANDVQAKKSERNVGPAKGRRV